MSYGGGAIEVRYFSDSPFYGDRNVAAPTDGDNSSGWRHSCRHSTKTTGKRSEQECNVRMWEYGNEKMGILRKCENVQVRWDNHSRIFAFPHFRNFSFSYFHIHTLHPSMRSAFPSAASWDLTLGGPCSPECQLRDVNIAICQICFRLAALETADSLRFHLI